MVPFTTPDLTRAAMDAANRMGAGLNPALRLVKVQVVPYPLDLNQPPVYIDFLKDQLAQFHRSFRMTGEVRLAREFEAGLDRYVVARLSRDSGHARDGHGKRAPNAWPQHCAAPATKSFWYLPMERQRLTMLDIAYCLLIVAFFAVAWMMVRACERLQIAQASACEQVEREIWNT